MRVSMLTHAQIAGVSDIGATLSTNVLLQTRTRISMNYHFPNIGILVLVWIW